MDLNITILIHLSDHDDVIRGPFRPQLRPLNLRATPHKWSQNWCPATYRFERG